MARRGALIRRMLLGFSFPVLARYAHIRGPWYLVYEPF